MISVIIPTYKSPEALDLCLRSAIEGQENKNQIIVVVDGFYDLNKEVLEKWSEHIDVLNLEQNVGLCRGTNLGVYNAQYDKILIINDDNVFPDKWDTTLETIYEYNNSVNTNVNFDPTIKDGKCTVGLKVNKTNWANKIDTAPFYAYGVTCGITFTFGGLRINNKGQVLNKVMKPIKGLYAAGEMVGGIFYFNYPGGSGLTSGAVFGRLAGKSAAKH